MEEQQCNANISTLFSDLINRYGQDNPDNFYLSPYDVNGYRLGLLQRNQSTRIYTSYNYSSSLDELKVKTYDTNGAYFKCFNCDLCNIVDKEGVLVVDKLPVPRALTKTNIAKANCVNITTTPIPLVLSASDDQYLTAQAMLTTVNHIPNHYTFMIPALLQSIFQVLIVCQTNNPGITAYFNGRFGSSEQHSHVHVSPLSSPLVATSKNAILLNANLNEANDFAYFPVDCKGILGLCIATTDANLVTFGKFCEAYVMQHILLSNDAKKAFVAHLFTTTKNINGITRTVYGICFLTCNDSTTRNCTIYYPGTNKRPTNISIITAISTVSLMEVNNAVQPGTFFSKDFIEKDLPGCLTDYNESQYIPFDKANPVLDGESVDTCLNRLRGECQNGFVKELLNYMGLSDVELTQTSKVSPYKNVLSSLERVSYFLNLSGNDDQAKINICCAIAQGLLTMKVVTTFRYNLVANLVFSSLFSQNVNGNIATTSKPKVDYLMTQFKLESINLWLSTFMAKLPSLGSGTCYALRGNYLQPRINDTVRYLYEYFKKLGKVTVASPFAKGAYGSVARSSNLFPLIGIAGTARADVVIKTQRWGNDAARQSLFNHEVGVGLELNNFRGLVPNIMMTYFGVDVGSEGYMVVEDVRGITLTDWINNSFDWSQFLAITGCLLTSIYMLKKECNFSHYDLHCENILLLPVKDCGLTVGRTLEVDYEIALGLFKNFDLEYIPVIIDYGFVFTKTRYMDPGYIWFPNIPNWFIDCHLFFNHAFSLLENLSFTPMRPTDPDRPFKDAWFDMFAIYYAKAFPPALFPAKTAQNLWTDLNGKNDIYPPQFRAFMTKYNIEPWHLIPAASYGSEHYGKWVQDVDYISDHNRMLWDIIDTIPSYLRSSPDSIKFPINEVGKRPTDMIRPEASAIVALSSYTPPLPPTPTVLKPEEEQKSPMRVDVESSPMRVESSPMRVDVESSPMRVDVESSPMRVENSPMRVENSPMRVESSPMRLEEQDFDEALSAAFEEQAKINPVKISSPSRMKVSKESTVPVVKMREYTEQDLDQALAEAFMSQAKQKRKATASPSPSVQPVQKFKKKEKR